MNPFTTMALMSLSGADALPPTPSRCRTCGADLVDVSPEGIDQPVWGCPACLSKPARVELSPRYVYTAEERAAIEADAARWMAPPKPNRAQRRRAEREQRRAATRARRTRR